MIDNYNPDKSKEQLDFVVGWVMDKAVDTDKLVMASLGVVDYVVRWAHNFTGDINCTDIIQLNDTGLCYPDPWGTWNCSTVPPVMALCTMITASNLSLVDPNLQVALLEQAGISIDEVFETVQTEVVAALDLATTSLYPDELYMLTVPLGIAIFFAIVNAIRLAVTYLPSVTTTIIQLRTGVIKSLGDPEFEKYRVAPDTVTLLTGTIFWGALVSSALFGLVVGLIFFLLLWQGTQRLVQRLTVLLIGLIIVIIIRLAVRGRRKVLTTHHHELCYARNTFEAQAPNIYFGFSPCPHHIISVLCSSSCRAANAAVSRDCTGPVQRGLTSRC